jgi:hypothetical protein
MTKFESIGKSKIRDQQQMKERRGEGEREREKGALNN